MVIEKEVTKTLHRSNHHTLFDDFGEHEMLPSFYDLLKGQSNEITGFFVNLKY
jgi:hypothetical protein